MDLFSKKAGEWDANTMRQELSQYIGGAIQDLLSSSHKVLDFGAGTGLITEHIARQSQQITAVDISQSMLEKLQEKEGLSDVRIVCQDITSSPLEDDFDAIVSAMAVHHVEDTELLLKRFFEMLNPSGFIALADLDKEDGSFHPPKTEGIFHHGFDRNEFQNLLETIGFTDVTFKTVHSVEKEDMSYPIFLVTAKKSA